MKDHLTKSERKTASNAAKQIERFVNLAFGRRVATCSPPMVFDAGDLPSLDDDLRFGLELRIELEAIVDSRDQPADVVAKRLREWGARLHRAADALEGPVVALAGVA